MRVNVYQEEQTDRIEITDEIAQTGTKYFGVRFYLHSSNRLHKDKADDDSSAITFWATDLHFLKLLFERALEEIKSK